MVARKIHCYDHVQHQHYIKLGFLSALPLPHFGMYQPYSPIPQDCSVMGWNLLHLGWSPESNQLFVSERLLTFLIEPSDQFFHPDSK
jgi:hypothetical protein